MAAVPAVRAQDPAADAMSPSWRQAETQGAWVTTACWLGRLKGWFGPLHVVAPEALSLTKTVGMMLGGSVGEELTLGGVSRVTRPVRTTLRVNSLAGVPTNKVTACVMVDGAKTTWPATKERSMIPARAKRLVLLKLRTGGMLDVSN